MPFLQDIKNQITHQQLEAWIEDTQLQLQIKKRA